MDVIADYLTIIRNGCRAKKNEIEVRYSKLKYEISRVLLEEGYINNFRVDDPDNPKKIIITLKYDNNGESIIHNLVRVSKPGRRVYVKANQIRQVHQGLGVAIISTSSGVLTDRQARQKKTGGELLGYIY